MTKKLINHRRVEINNKWDDDVWVKTKGLLINYEYPVSYLKKCCEINDPTNTRYINAPFSRKHGYYHWPTDKVLPLWLREKMELYRT